MKKSELSKREITHQRIIEKAAELFNTKGYASTSITDIMEASDLQKGGIYSHFKNKEELELSAFDYLLNRTFELFDSSIINNKTTAEKLFIWIDYRESLNDTLLKGGCPLFNAGNEAFGYNQELNKHVKNSMERWKESIVEVLKEGISKKDVKSGLDPEEFALHFITVLEGASFLTQVYNDGEYKSKAIERLKRTIKEEVER
jgi:TetR/AcrR family transcriptional regulator, transcriptional repressor for nem operon